MIVKRTWRKYHRKHNQFSDRMGIFLFGFIPIYMECQPWRF